MSHETVAFAPGRANLIGEHTDYNRGLALPFAITEGVTVRAAALPERRVEAVAADLGESDEFDLDHPDHTDGWCAYVRGAAAELQAAGHRLCGARLHISGSVPRGSGLSSSAALEVATSLALCRVAGRPAPGRLDLARLCSKVENDWVGAQTGLLDQLASLFGEPERALRIDFDSLEVAPVELELGDFSLITLDSGERHTNAASGYNERRAECAEACRELGIGSLREGTLEMVERLAPPLDRRVRHIVTENGRVQETVEALRHCDFEAVGRLLDSSHASLRDDYEISTAAVDATVKRCKDAGALGARIMGGGFGGAVLALLPPGAGAPDGAVPVRPGQGARVNGTPS